MRLLILASILIGTLAVIGCGGGGGDGSDGYTITYLPNGATSGTVPVDKNTYAYLETAVILGNSGNLEKTDAYFAGWNTKADGTGSDYEAGIKVVMRDDLTLYANWVSGAQRTFRAVNAETNVYYDVESTLMASGDHCMVYVENGADVTEAVAQAVADCYDDSIYDQISTAFGAIEDVDNNGKVILLLLDIQDGYTGSGGYVAGYFDPVNMFDSNSEPNSNEADMLFLDTYPSVAGDADFFSTMAHELQHLINFSNTYMVDGTEQDLWINEGLSSGAEYVYSGAVNQDRVDWFNYNGNGAIVYGNNFFVWYGYWENEDANNVLDNYATVSLFFQWLRIHASNGTAIYKDILSSSYRDYRAVTDAAALRIADQDGTWLDLLRTWDTANVLCNATGEYGYEGELTVSMPYFNAVGGATAVYLSPGEGLVSANAGAYTPTASGVNIKYRGIDTDTDAVVDAAGYTGNRILVLNANNDNGGADEKGYPASIAGGTKLSVVNPQASTRPLPKSWKVDLHIGPDGRIADVNRKQLSAANRVLKKADIKGLRKAK